MSKPTLIFAPGEWYPKTAFDPIIEKLSDYRSHTVAFPSVQQSTSIVDLQPDIDAVRSLVQQEAEEGNDVIIIVHSWAGLPVSSALEGLSKAEREKAGQKGGVVKLLFISAFLPNVGESLIGAFGGNPPPWYVRDEENGTVMPSDPLVLFFHDVPDGAKWADSLQPHAWATKNAPATGVAYFHIPTVYLLCEEDRAIPLPVQQVLVNRAQRMGADIKTETIKTGHTPWLASPDQFLAYIKKQVEV